MATYKDTDEILKEIFYQASRSSLGETTIPYLYWKNIVAIIKDAPTVDYCSDDLATALEENEVLKAELSRYTENVKQMCEKAKQEVAREIFEEIENNYADFLFDGHRNIVVLTEKDFAELKKKYTEGET